MTEVTHNATQLLNANVRQIGLGLDSIRLQSLCLSNTTPRILLISYSSSAHFTTTRTRMTHRVFPSAVAPHCRGPPTRSDGYNEERLSAPALLILLRHHSHGTADSVSGSQIAFHHGNGSAVCFWCFEVREEQDVSLFCCEDLNSSSLTFANCLHALRIWRIYQSMVGTSLGKEKRIIQASDDNLK